jgi:hypothetical protein
MVQAVKAHALELEVEVLPWQPAPPVIQAVTLTETVQEMWKRA